MFTYLIEAPDLVVSRKRGVAVMDGRDAVFPDGSRQSNVDRLVVAGDIDGFRRRKFLHRGGNFIDNPDWVDPGPPPKTEEQLDREALQATQKEGVLTASERDAAIKALAKQAL